MGGFGPDHVEQQQQLLLQEQQPQPQNPGTTGVQYQSTMKHDRSSPVCVKAVTAMPKCELEEITFEDCTAGKHGIKGHVALLSVLPGFGEFSVTLGESKS